MLCINICKTLILVYCVLSYSSCTSLLCGELSGDWRIMMGDAEAKYSDKLVIENIPCEFYYLDVKLKKGVGADTVLIAQAHRDLYNPEKRIGWLLVNVYDSNNKYIFSHRHNGGIYVR